jgi:hypothetical protein
MKQRNILLIFASILLITSCIKDPDHSIRVKNLSDRIVSITIDDTLIFDSIAINQKTQYVPINEGTHKIGGDYSGNFVVEGDGTIKWTLEILNDNFNLVQD